VPYDAARPAAPRGQTTGSQARSLRALSIPSVAAVSSSEGCGSGADSNRSRYPVTRTRDSGGGLTADGRDPVSPELALVDPELARRERAQLPLPPPPARREPHPPDTARASGRPSVPTAPLPPQPEPPRQRSRGRRVARRVAAMTALAAIGAAGIAAASVARHGEQPELGAPAAQVPSADTPAAPRRARQPTRSGARATTTRAAAGATRTRAATGTQPPPTPPPAATQTTAAPAPPPRTGPEPRTFAWLPVPRATHYRVEFYRGPTRILVAFPARPRLVVPGRWKYRGRVLSFSAGTYRWTVRAGFGPRARARYGPAVVASRWVVTD
jgi:hypothetical protein